MRSCAEVREHVASFVALEMAPDVEAEVRAHLEACEACRGLYVATEPSLLLSLGAGRLAAVEDDAFVSQVLGGLHQRRVEQRLRGHRRWWLAAAAAVVVAVLGGTATYVQWRETPPFAVTADNSNTLDPALVEVEGEGVRLYQLTPPSRNASDVQVAFIVDPQLEL